VIGSTSTVIHIEHAKENDSFGPFSGVDPLSEKLDLRLFTVYGIIAEARGSISAQMKSGHRVSFEIVLPQGPGKNEQQSMRPAVESLPDAPAVLLIEKDNDIRNLVLTGLEGSGFEALGARNAQEALEWIDLYAAPIALLITELEMAGMTGVPLAERIMLRHPRMRTLFIINKAVDSVSCERWKNQGSRFLEHPFRLKDLLALVNEMLVPGDSNNLQPEFSSFSSLTQ
jgi:CheY-like chemotaxis protein